MTRKLEVPPGTMFGRLTVVEEAEPGISPSGERSRRMRCRCDCGAILITILKSLASGNTTSCGCYKLETLAARVTTHGRTVRKNKYPPNYLLWSRIKRRTVTGSSPDRKNYLDRGISMYEPWQKDFVAFDTWLNEHLGPCPEGWSLDRIDNDGNYEPGNLKWSDRTGQANNRTSNVLVEYEGQTKTIAQWAELLELNYTTLWQRLSVAKWPVEKAFTTPVRKRQREG